MNDKGKHDYEIREVIRGGWLYIYKYFMNTDTSVLIRQEKINE